MICQCLPGCCTVLLIEAHHNYCVWVCTVLNGCHVFVFVGSWNESYSTKDVLSDDVPPMFSPLGIRQVWGSKVLAMSVLGVLRKHYGI